MIAAIDAVPAPSKFPKEGPLVWRGLRNVRSLADKVKDGRISSLSPCERTPLRLCKTLSQSSSRSMIPEPSLLLGRGRNGLMFYVANPLRMNATLHQILCIGTPSNPGTRS